MHARKALIVWLAVAISMVLGAWKPIPCPPTALEDSARVDCTSCKGVGRIAQHCLACFGAGASPCRTCASPIDVEPVLERNGSLTPDKRVEFVETFREAAKVLSKFSNLARLVSSKPGRATCPARCVDGKQPMAGGAACKYCNSKGEFECKDCRKSGKLTCAACAGRKRIERRCDDCAGEGKLPDVLPLSDEQLAECPWCAGAGSFECSECDERGCADGVCSRCAGKQAYTCTRCLGTSKAPCNDCIGTGFENPLFRLDAPSSKPASCRSCVGAGSQHCAAPCSRGRVVCELCKGARDYRPSCLACNGSRRRPCFGCHRDAYRSWEWAAEQFSAAGERERARKCLETARARIDRRYATLLREALDPDESKAALARARDADRKRISERLAELSAAKD